MSQPFVSVILLNWNGLEDTLLCLDSIKKQTYTNFETIVVDNGSVDGSVDTLSQREDITLVLNKKNRGFTGGHIDGLKQAKGDFILLLNNDAVMKPNLIETAVKSFNDPTIAVVGGRAYKWNDDNPLFNESNEFYSYQFVNPFNAEAIFYQKDYGVSEEVNNVSGSCVMIRRDIINELDYLEDRFFAYYEECDLFARIKRSGYKVIYNPNIAIWHKIGASSSKKSSSFMFYMLFRNRFFFAVRNFQKDYLKKFLFSYFKLGIKSSVKLLIRRGDQIYNKAFARAFYYNIFHAYKSFSERKKLINKLGPSRYNDQILQEQENISHVVVASSTKEVESLLKASKLLRPSHELIIVSGQSYVKALPNNVRVCVDRGYFNTAGENYGAITARYNWVSFADVKSFTGQDYPKLIDRAISAIVKSTKKTAIFSKYEIDPKSNSYSYFLPLIVRREVFLEFHGIHENAASLFPLIWYSYQKGYSLFIKEGIGKPVKQVFSREYFEKIHQIIAQQNIFNKAKRIRSYERIFNRFYRLQQARSILLWLFSFRIPIRLKLARIKNLILFTITVNRQKLATEIKHIRNEVLRTHGHLQLLTSQQIKAKKNFKLLSEEPTSTPVFIICRDRVTPLKELVGWLEKAGMRKIVFIDNDSLYPELVKYLESSPYQVLKMHRNPGHTVAWNQSIIPILVPAQYYILTDPDVIPATDNAQLVLQALYGTHKKYKDYMKVGLGLKINDLPDHFSLKNEVIQWESQFWKVELEKNVFEAGVDTTFALYKPFTYTYILHPSIRLGEPYTARHLPWYLNDKELDTEDIFYRMHADQNVNSWNSGSLPDRYVKELQKQSKTR